MINRKAELVGVIFDGNIQSLTSDFFYSDELGRAVCVHSSGIREALKNILPGRPLGGGAGKMNASVQVNPMYSADPD